MRSVVHSRCPYVLKNRKWKLKRDKEEIKGDLKIGLKALADKYGLDQIQDLVARMEESKKG